MHFQNNGYYYLSDEGFRSKLWDHKPITDFWMIAEGIKGAVEQIKINVPVVVRLEGNQAHLGEKILNECGLNIVSARDLRQAAILAVKAAKSN